MRKLTFLAPSDQHVVWLQKGLCTPNISYRTSNKYAVVCDVSGRRSTALRLQFCSHILQGAPVAEVSVCITEVIACKRSQRMHY